MYKFKNDYNRVCHKNILNRLNLEYENNYVGYGNDIICESAKDKIRKLLQKDVDIHFLVGGTQANKIIISSILKPYEGVISVKSGHIATHETGAIESSGHKVLELKGIYGKIDVLKLDEYLKEYHIQTNKEHIVKPGMVYLSNPTELGTIYKKEELNKIHKVCKKYRIPLFLDGARLAYLFDARENDIDFKDLNDLVDIYYIGGTKCGAMFGEAVVFNNKKYSVNFRHNIKQGGGLLAKGFILGLQFDELFSNNLYFKLGEHANKMSNYFEEELKKLKVKMYVDRYSNQIFPIFDINLVEKLSKFCDFEKWCFLDGNKVCIRFVISWATNKEDIDDFLKQLKSIICK